MAAARRAPDRQIAARGSVFMGVDPLRVSPRLASDAAFALAVAAYDAAFVLRRPGSTASAQLAEAARRAAAALDAAGRSDAPPSAAGRAREALARLRALVAPTLGEPRWREAALDLWGCLDEAERLAAALVAGSEGHVDPSAPRARAQEPGLRSG
ncbi:MAG TPA: hypothetical protein VFE44_05510 [Thermoanaerobaculia bacterium]|nr:hypothetical protein [Thermoanaerobaculia bacterium]